MDERDEQRLLELLESLVVIGKGNRLASWLGALVGAASTIVAITALVALIMLAT